MGLLLVRFVFLETKKEVTETIKAKDDISGEAQSLRESNTCMRFILRSCRTTCQGEAHVTDTRNAVKVELGPM